MNVAKFYGIIPIGRCDDCVTRRQKDSKTKGAEGMKHHWIVTVGRQFCSGGAQTAKLAAQLLNVPCYDRQIIDEAAGVLKMTVDDVERHDEKPTGFWEYSGYANYWYLGDPELSMPTSVRVAEAQFEAIRKFAKEGSCVMIGRCADQILRERPHTLSVFIRADLEKRIERAGRLYQMDEAQAKKLIRRTDKIRADYYNLHTQKKWGAPERYALVLDTGVLGIEGAAGLIAACVRQLDEREDNATM